MSLRRSSYIVLILMATSVGCMAQRTFADRIATPKWPDFMQKVNAHKTMVDRLEKELPALPDKATAEQMTAHKQSLIAAVGKARSGARQGDIFSKEIAQRFVAIIRSEVRGPSGKAAKETIKEDNPNHGNVQPVTLAVNAVYPDKAPLSTVPPTLLLRLPTLPETVDYRFVGKALVLHDVRSNLIIDYMTGAEPKGGNS